MPNGSHNRHHHRRQFTDTCDQNDGIEGVVYILKNEAFKETWVKIGQSRYSGDVRARDMNREASTGIPKHHVCVFECKTLDCGRAEKAVFTALKGERRGRQEYFEVDLEAAKLIILRECARIDELIIANKTNTAKTEFVNDVESDGGPSPQPGSMSSATRKIDITCPNCKGPLTAPPIVDSQKIRCPICKCVFARTDGQLATSAIHQRELAQAWPWVFGAIGLLILSAFVVDQTRLAELPEKPKSLVIAKTESAQSSRLAASPPSVVKKDTVPPVKVIASPHDLAERLRQKPNFTVQFEKGDAWIVSALMSDDKRIRLLIQFRSKTNNELILGGAADNVLTMLKPGFCGAAGLLSTYNLKSFSVSVIPYENDVRLGEIPLPKEFCATRLSDQLGKAVQPV